MAKDAQRAEADVERGLERFDHGAREVDTRSGITVGDECEVARAEVAEVVFGSQLAEPVRDFTQEFLDAGSTVDLGDAAQLNHLHENRGDLGVALAARQFGGQGREQGAARRPTGWEGR